MALKCIAAGCGKTVRRRLCFFLGEAVCHECAQKRLFSLAGNNRYWRKLRRRVEKADLKKNGEIGYYPNINAAEYRIWAEIREKVGFSGFMAQYPVGYPQFAWELWGDERSDFVRHTRRRAERKPRRHKESLFPEGEDLPS